MFWRWVPNKMKFLRERHITSKKLLNFHLDNQGNLTISPSKLDVSTYPPTHPTPKRKLTRTSNTCREHEQHHHKEKILQSACYQWRVSEEHSQKVPYKVGERHVNFQLKNSSLYISKTVWPRNSETLSILFPKFVKYKFYKTFTTINFRSAL